MEQAKDKTAATRMKRYRSKQAAAFPENMKAAYLKGFNDALEGLNPAPVEIWVSKDAAIGYVCGGIDCHNALSQRKFFKS